MIRNLIIYRRGMGKKGDCEGRKRGSREQRG
jgi:hypothetical protein